MLDTWQPGRKQRIRSRHIMAVEKILTEWKNQPPQVFHDDPVTPEQSRLIAKFRFHEKQAELWGQSIAEFGDEEE